MEPLTVELAQSLGLRDARGAVVARVYPGVRRRRPGLQKNDVVVSFEGTVVDDYRQLQRLSADAEVGKTVKLEVVRNRERRAITLRVAEAPDRLTPERQPSPRSVSPAVASRALSPASPGARVQAGGVEGTRSRQAATEATRPDGAQPQRSERTRAAWSSRPLPPGPGPRAAPGGGR